MICSVSLMAARFAASMVQASRLHLANAQRVHLELSSREKFLARIVQPDFFFILLIAGVLGLYTEFTHPGMVLPGVIGGICIVLAMYAMHLLPVNIAGIVLILLRPGNVHRGGEIHEPWSAGGGGVVAMLLGALMLIRSPLTAGGVSLAVAFAVTCLSR